MAVGGDGFCKLHHMTSTREAISSGAASFIEPESSAYEGSERGWEFGGIGLREFGSGV